MRRVLPFLLLASVASIAAPAHAQVNMAWNNCITESNAADNIAYACDGSRNGQPFRCVVSVIPPFTLTQFIGVETFIDVYDGSGPSEHPLGALPDFWRLATGECRDGNLAAPSTFNGIGSSACLNPWTVAHETATDVKWTSFSDHAGLYLLFVMDTATPLTSGQQYLMNVCSLDTWKDTDKGQGECAGCCSAVALVLNHMVLYQVAGAQPQDVVTMTGPSWVTWQSTDGNHVPGCAATPARRSTWGSIKATYR